MPTIAETFALAERAHRGQPDKLGDPYIEHVRAVGALMAHHGPEGVKAGLLHDIVEDTDVTLGELRERGYSELVIGAVDAVTARDGELYDERILRAIAHPLGKHVKLADNTHNTWPSRVARLKELKRLTAAAFGDRYHRARLVLLAAGATLTPDTDAVSTADDPLPCPVLNDAGQWCAKPIHTGWPVSDGHGGGHRWITVRWQAIVAAGHYDAVALISGRPAEGHLPEECPGEQCPYLPLLRLTGRA